MQVSVQQNANVRGGPGTDYEVVGSLAAGDTVIVVATNPTGDWVALDDGTWVAAFLLESTVDLPTTTPSPTPTPTLTPTPTMTPNVAATATAEARAAAQATIDTRVAVPPDGIWCGQNDSVIACVGDFTYTRSAGYSYASAGSRFVAFVMLVQNDGSTSTHVNPFNVTMIMADGRTYAHDSETYSYWDQPMQAVDVIPGASAGGGLVFLVADDVAPERIVYETSDWFDDDVVIDLTEPPMKDN